MPTGVQLMITSAIAVARCDQVTVRQPTSSARLVAALVVAVGDRHARPAPRQAEGDRPGHAAGAEDQHLLVEQRAGRSGSSIVAQRRLRASPSRRGSRCCSRSTCRRRSATTVLHEPVRSTGFSFCFEQRDDVLLVGDRHAASLDVEPLQLVEERARLAGGDQERRMTLFRPSWRNAALWMAGLRLWPIGSPITP